jgi:hypothetical protein
MPNLYNHITAAAPTTTTVTDGPCVLERIVINKAVATGEITIYDGTATVGSIVAIITQPNPVKNDQLTLYYGVVIKKKLTIVTATAAQDITVVYRPV